MKGMNKVNKMYPCQYYLNKQMYPCPYCANAPMQNFDFSNQFNPYYDEEEDNTSIKLKDYGPKPFVVNIEEVTKQNNNFRTTLWTGEHLQLTLMSIKAGEEIGLEIHPDLDQFIRIEEGQGLVKMGDKKDRLDFQEKVYDDFAFIIPAGKWHNLVNTGNKPLKLYSIYAPPQHPKGTVHETKAVAEAAEENHGH
jgi:mannose-6-phosphate isomerase-like protein (cupin superfamily)